MKIVRVLRRSLLLILHLLNGILINLFTRRYPTANGESLPDPQVVSDWLKRVCRIFDLELQVTGSCPHTRALLVANHVSWLDIPVLASLSHTSFLSKDGIRRWPVIGWFAASSGAVFIRRGKGEAQQVAEAIAHRLSGDRQLTIFPEGTTSNGRQVRNFFPRLFSAAITTATPVVPVTLRYEMDGKLDGLAPFIDGQHFLRNLFGLLGRKSGSVRVIFADPIAPTGKDRRTLAEEARQVIVDNLACLAAEPGAATKGNRTA